MEDIENDLIDARDALDHIIRTCDASRSQTRRLKWIKERAKSGLNGSSDWRKIELPRNAENLIITNRKLKIENECLKAKIAELNILLSNCN